MFIVTKTHIDKFYNAFQGFKDIPYYAKVSTNEDILSFDGNMNINFYVKREGSAENLSFEKVIKQWNDSGDTLKSTMNNLFELLN